MKTFLFTYNMASDQVCGPVPSKFRADISFAKAICTPVLLLVRWATFNQAGENIRKSNGFERLPVNRKVMFCISVAE